MQINFTKLLYLILQNINYLSDFLLPRLCVSCSTKLSVFEKTICTNCFSEFEKADQSLIRSEFQRKFASDKIISNFSTAYIFRDNSPIEKLIHSLKYNQNYHVGKFLGKQVGTQLEETIYSWNADLIIPIPLHPLRKADRGFNQASEISKGISKILNIPFSQKIIKRNRYTQTQTKFNISERKENIAGAFSIKNAKIINNKNIILVDDIITTGATTTECAKVLLENGANKIFAISVAIAD